MEKPRAYLNNTQYKGRPALKANGPVEIPAGTYWIDGYQNEKKEGWESDWTLSFKPAQPKAGGPHQPQTSYQKPVDNRGSDTSKPYPFHQPPANNIPF